MQKLYLSIIVSFIVPILVLSIGDGMYTGLWYYFTIPFIFLGLSAGLKLTSSFYTGLSTAIFLSFIIFLSINWTAQRPDGLLGLGHIFSLPGALLSVIFTASWLEKNAYYMPRQNFMSGFFSFSLGFILNLSFLFFYVFR